ncbi:MAG TPA: hypothetical protein VGH21_00265 [Solirubrobacteraceae bacterium]
MSSASAAKTLELSTSEGVLVPGALIDLGGVNVFESTEGAIECPDGLLVASLLTNGNARDKISVAAGVPTGKSGFICSTSTSMGPVEVKVGGLPWTQQFAASGKALLKGHHKLQVALTVPVVGGLKCSYETPRISETFPLAANGVAAPLVLAVEAQTLVRSFGSSIVCPAILEAEAASIPVSVLGSRGDLLPVDVTRRVVAKH